MCPFLRRLCCWLSMGNVYDSRRPCHPFCKPLVMSYVSYRLGMGVPLLYLETLDNKSSTSYCGSIRKGFWFFVFTVCEKFRMKGMTTLLPVLNLLGGFPQWVLRLLGTCLRENISQRDSSIISYTPRTLGAPERMDRKPIVTVWP